MNPDPAEQFRPAPNRVSRRANGQYRSIGCGAVYRAIRNAMREPLQWKPIEPEDAA